MPYSHFKSLSVLEEHTQGIRPASSISAGRRGNRALCAFLLAAGLSTALPAFPQEPTNAIKIAPPATIKQPTTPKGAAYNHFALGHLYEELAATYDNRTDYVNKAIENFRLAIKEDPTATFLIEDIAELYRVSGRIREAVEEAQGALKANPDDINAHRVLAHIYTSQIGDAQSNKVDEGMVRRALEQYKFITSKDPKDVESLVMLGRLNRVVENSVDAEAAFKSAIALDADNEDAITGLASVYSDRGDTKNSTALLEKLAQKNPSPRALVTLANNYEAMKQYSLAADAYKKALALDPSKAELRALLAQDEALAQRYDDAIKTYQDMAAANPQDASPYLGMAQVYQQQRKMEDARRMMDKAKQLDPDNIEIRYDEVRLLIDEGKTPEAIAALKAILESTTSRAYNPNQKMARSKMLEELGGLYRQNDQIDLAIETFRQMVTLDPDNGARSSAEIIDTYRLSKDYAKAQQESAEAATKYPNDRILHEVRAELLSDQGKIEPAISELKKLLDGKTDREVYLKMADTYQKGRNFAEMGKMLDAAEKLSTTDEDRASVTFMRGAMYEREKKYDLAEKEFRRVVDQDGKNASALNYLGYMLADQGTRLQEASGYIERAVAIEPNNYAFLDSLGWVYFRMNRLDEAEKQLTRSVQIMSKDPTIHDHLGDVYFKKGKLKEAIAEWQSTVKQIGTSSSSDIEPDELAKVQKKLDSARVRLAKEQGPPRNN
ncbi:MAG TPA: tetratricopeptide repeat protein [Bryobacteraceae bacterium]|nr:tetratricopeptide repeat protein [Bryobacteraceae bacterium]